MSQAIAYMIWDTFEQKLSPNKRKAKTIKCSCTPLVWVLLMACNLEAQTFQESHCFVWSLLFCLFALFFFSLCFGCTAFGIVVSQLGIKPVPPAVEAWSLNHWTTRELLEAIVLIRHGKAETRKLSSLADTSPVTQRPSVMKPTIETKGHSNWPDWRAFLQANAGVPT